MPKPATSGPRIKVTGLHGAACRRLARPVLARSDGVAGWQGWRALPSCRHTPALSRARRGIFCFFSMFRLAWPASVKEGPAFVVPRGRVAARERGLARSRPVIGSVFQHGEVK